MSELVDVVAVYLAAIKFPDREWGDLKTSTTERFKQFATVLISEIESHETKTQN